MYDALRETPVCGGAVADSGINGKPLQNTLLILVKPYSNFVARLVFSSFKYEPVSRTRGRKTRDAARALRAKAEASAAFSRAHAAELTATRSHDQCVTNLRGGREQEVVLEREKRELLEGRRAAMRLHPASWPGAARCGAASYSAEPTELKWLVAAGLFAPTATLVRTPPTVREEGTDETNGRSAAGDAGILNVVARGGAIGNGGGTNGGGASAGKWSTGGAATGGCPREYTTAISRACSWDSSGRASCTMAHILSFILRKAGSSSGQETVDVGAREAAERVAVAADDDTTAACNGAAGVVAGAAGVVAGVAEGAAGGAAGGAAAREGAARSGGAGEAEGRAGEASPAIGLAEDARAATCPLRPRKHRRTSRVGRADGRTASVLLETPPTGTLRSSSLLGVDRYPHRPRLLRIGFNNKCELTLGARAGGRPLPGLQKTRHTGCP
eukprot:jgi/Undpi1/13104/HiC_scaffold_8.g02766.m1